MIKRKQERENSMANKVFVAQENPRVDIISATKWGDLIPLSNFTDQLHLNTGRLVAQIKRKLKDLSLIHI